MSPRIKKLFGGVAILVFLAVYCAAAITLADLVPNIWWAKLIYFVVVGVAWGLPIIPLISWMNKAREAPRR